MSLVIVNIVLFICLGLDYVIELQKKTLTLLQEISKKLPCQIPQQQQQYTQAEQVNE